MALTTAGCPRFEDAKSGTYQQVEFRKTATGPAVQLDFFRFGDHARAVLRYYQRNEVTQERFGEQTFCTWTWENEFDEESGEFRLPIQRSSRIKDGYVTGTLREDGTMQAKIVDESTGETILPQTQMERIDESPRPECDMIGDFLIRPTFNLYQTRINRMPKEANYEIENPVFSIQWVGVEQYEDSDSSGQFLAAINAQGPTTRLREPRFNPDGNALQGALSLPLPPPPEKILVLSGSTRYALGHLVVVDDQQEEGSFRWNVDSEPVVASAMQLGRRPEGPANANGTGKAILFVEGSIDELDPALLNDRIEGEEQVQEPDYPDSHFYIVDVDVDFVTDEVLQLTLPASPRNRSIPMMVTDQYLGSRGTQLPRLFPYQ